MAAVSVFVNHNVFCILCFWPEEYKKRLHIARGYVIPFIPFTGKQSKSREDATPVCNYFDK